MSRKYLIFPEKFPRFPDSRNKFVFLPKQPLLELSPPVKTEIFTKKSVILEKLANGKYVFEIQPTDCGSLIIFQSVAMVVESLCEGDDRQVHFSGVISLQTSLKKDQCKHLKSVHVSADFYGEYQSNQEAKHSKSLVFNNISHFRCLVMMHKLNEILNLRHRHDRPLTRPAVSSLGGPIERRKSNLPRTRILVLFHRQKN